jgi:hypothetical protein
MSVDEEEEAGVESVEDTEMKDGITRGGKSVERGGVGKPKTRKKKNTSKGDGKTNSHSSEAGMQDKKTVR